jgi:nitrous oxide reductase accessory protein NosL
MDLIRKVLTVMALGLCVGVLQLHANEGDGHDAAHVHGDAEAEKASYVEAPQRCKCCNMDRNKFAHSRALVGYQDGTTVGTYSINCAVIELDATAAKKVKLISVADFRSKKLIDAKSAVWVIGGSVRGVMTKTPKWAFADRKGADGFIKDSGGKIATFDEVLAATREEIAGRGYRNTHGHESHEHT